MVRSKSLLKKPAKECSKISKITFSRVSNAIWNFLPYQITLNTQDKKLCITTSPGNKSFFRWSKKLLFQMQKMNTLQAAHCHTVNKTSFVDQPNHSIQLVFESAPYYHPSRELLLNKIALL